MSDPNRHEFIVEKTQMGVYRAIRAEDRDEPVPISGKGETEIEALDRLTKDLRIRERVKEGYEKMGIPYRGRL